MYPILFRIGNTAVRTYTVLVDLGLLAGLALAYWLWHRRGQPLTVLLDAATCALIGGILGGRGAFVAMNWPYFSQVPKEIFAVWNGGVSFHGALVGGLLAVLLYTLAVSRPFWDLADAAALGLTLGALFSWFACLAAGCAYGAIGEGVLSIYAPDVFGSQAERFATQIVGIILSLITLGLLLLLVMLRKRAGVVFSAFLLLYFGGQFFLEFFRGDETIWLGPLRIAQVFDAGLALAGLALLLIVRRRPLPVPEEGENAEDEGAKEVEATITDEPAPTPADAAAATLAEEPASPLVGVEKAGVDQPESDSFLQR